MRGVGKEEEEPDLALLTSTSPPPAPAAPSKRRKHANDDAASVPMMGGLEPNGVDEVGGMVAAMQAEAVELEQSIQAVKQAKVEVQGMCEQGEVAIHAMIEEVLAAATARDEVLVGAMRAARQCKMERLEEQQASLERRLQQARELRELGKVVREQRERGSGGRDGERRGG